jgi:outer membrane protein
MRIFLVFLLIGTTWAQQSTLNIPVNTPDIQGYEGNHFWSRLAGKYLPISLPYTQFANSNRIDSLMRAGNLYLSLQDAIALALENNLDIEYHRYDRKQAETDQLRASAGQLLRFQGGNIRAGFSSATSGALAGTSSFNATSGGSGGQSSILSGFSIQAAGSNIPNLEPLFFASWQASHQTRPLTNSVATGTNYLISSAHTSTVGIQKSFITGTKVTLDMSQQSLSQNAPANLYNPSLTGNAELSISQPLLQGFGVATNKRTITIAKNNLTVADLNFRAQVIATVKNVIDLYWDLVSLNDNLRAKQKSVDISTKLYEDNRKRLGIGAIAPIDIVQAEASMQTAQLDLRQARAQLLQQELILKSALTRTGVDSVTVMDAHIIPTDAIQVPETEAIQPIQDMIAEAFANRHELKLTQISMENNRINMKGVKNAMRPGLDVFIDMQNNALAGATNLQTIPLGTDGLPLFNRTEPNPYFLGNWGAVFGQLLGRNFPTYSVGFNLNIPLSNSAARADMIKNQLDYRQAQIDAKQQENTVRLNVVNARISLEQARAAYESAVKARKLQEQSFAGTQRKYELGTASFTDVALLQRDVVTSQTAENNAMNGYIKARSNMDVVLGRLLEAHNIDIKEAYDGKVSRQPDALPVLDPQPGSTKAGAMPAPAAKQ